jgi:S1-C subfamily serine protease
MVRVVFLVILLAVTCALPRGARADELGVLHAEFTYMPLDRSERRLLQTALAALGDYRGMLDGIWGPESRGAMERYVSRMFDDEVRNLHAAALVLTLADEAERHRWEARDFADIGVSFALPLAELMPPELEGDGLRWWSTKGALSVLALPHTPDDARLWHEVGRDRSARPEALFTIRRPELMVTSGVLADGRQFHSRSDRVGDGWATVYVVAGPDQSRFLNLIAASIRPGPPEVWDLARGGRLERLTELTLKLIEESWTPPEPVPAPLPENVARAPVAAAPPVTAAVAPPAAPTASGTGFYLGARTIVTAEHVIAGCAHLTLPDGSALAVAAVDPALDVAVLTSPRPSPVWLTLAPPRGLRLGQRIHALGYPYYSIASTALHLTSGNVSALAGIGDDGRFFSFSAPVQPGNSGGPLMDQSGRVLGVVVARLSEAFIAETTGSMPQNVNYAVSNTELFTFLRRSGIRAQPKGLGGFEMDGGAPEAISAAIVPILCD